jgi:hypothetical protein
LRLENATVSTRSALSSANNWLNWDHLLRGRPRSADEGTIGRGRLIVRFDFVPLDTKRVTASCNHVGRMEDMRGVKSSRRACAHHGDREPSEQTNGPAHCYGRGAAGSSACRGDSEPESS